MKNFLIIIFLLFGGLKLAQAKPWDNQNNPKYFDLQNDFVFNYDDLLNIVEDTKDHNGNIIVARPPSDTYWPNRERGLSKRWAGEVKRNFFNKQEYYFSERKLGKWIRQGKGERLYNLSPAEKLDLINGDFKWNTTRFERKRTSHRDPDWYGICDGWSPYACNFKAPQKTVWVNVRIDGLNFKLPFYISDINGLLSLMFSKYISNDDVKLPFAGTRSNLKFNAYGRGLIHSIRERRAHNNKKYMDVNPGSLHIILVNRLAIKHKPFVMDQTPGKEVWNQPLQGFAILNERFQSRHSRYVKTRLFWTTEIDSHKEVPEEMPYTAVDVDDNSARKYTDLEYVLDLDYHGNITGGKWLGNSVDQHPDFVWNKEFYVKNKFPSPFQKIKKVYLQSI